MARSPNPRLQRTPLRAPLSRKTLGHRSLFNAVSIGCYIAIVTIAQLLPTSLVACECGSIPEPAAALASSVAVLKGRVIEVSDPLWFGRRAWLRIRNFVLKPDITPEWYLENVGFRVQIRSEQSWKRSFPRDVPIVTGRGEGDCGFHFKVGESYLVYLEELPSGKLYTSICSRTKPVRMASGDLGALGKQRIPR